MFDSVGELCVGVRVCVCVCLAVHGDQRTVGGLPLWILSVFFSENDIPKLFHFSGRKWKLAKND